MAPEDIAVELPPDAQVLQCLAYVRSEEVRCEPYAPAAPSGLHLDLMLGGQDRYVRLTSSDTHFDSGTLEFRSTVTVQNLTKNSMGTDGISTPGVMVFFHSGPVAVSGSGNVLVGNADGTDTFTGTQQPYFLYPEVLEPLEISEGRQWVFQLGPDVTAFSFMVYVSAPVVEETAPLLGPVWTGAGGDTDWGSAANWQGGRLPAADSAVTIPADSLLGEMLHPTLAADDSVHHLRVGAGSTLNLGGFRLVVGGNLDVSGAVSGGPVQLTGTSALLGGTVPTLEVAGSVRLQRAALANGPVEVSGTLDVSEYPLTVSIP